MRVPTMAAALAIAAVLPSIAHAQETCQERAANRATGTVLGAAAGALIGSAVAGHGNRTEGAVIGGIAGGVAGNQLAKGPPDCAHAYGWYDNDGRWHRSGIDRANAYGYYDRHGDWVEGAPPQADYDADQGPPPPPARVYRESDTYRQTNTYSGGQNQAWSGYPEFQPSVDHIRMNIQGDVANGSIEADDARGLMHQLGDIQVEEAAAFSEHGWQLPADDRARIRGELRDLDHSVDQISEAP